MRSADAGKPVDDVLRDQPPQGYVGPLPVRGSARPVTLDSSKTVSTEHGVSSVPVSHQNAGLGISAHFEVPPADVDIILARSMCKQTGNFA